MADIELNIPQLSRVVNGIAKKHHYETRKLNGETKGQFAKRMLGEEFIIPALKDAENDEAYQINSEANNADIDANIIIT